MSGFGNSSPFFSIFTNIYRYKRDRGIKLQFMQDNAPLHTARTTVEDLQNKGIRIIRWPPYSFDLNLIEII